MLISNPSSSRVKVLGLQEQLSGFNRGDDTFVGLHVETHWFVACVSQSLVLLVVPDGIRMSVKGNGLVENVTAGWRLVRLVMGL
jgi:hypothetical protein